MNTFDGVKCDYYLVDEKENIIKRVNWKKPIACGILLKLKIYWSGNVEKLKFSRKLI